MSRYRLLFALEVRHTWFSSGWCAGVRIQPTGACEQLMRRYRLLFKPTAQGGEMYFDEAAQQSDVPGSLLDLSARESFTFTLASGFAPLANYTAIDAQPLATPGVSLYAFDNVGGGAATFDGKPYPLLHPAGTPFALGALACVSRRLRFHADAPVSQVTVRDAVTGAVVLGPQAIAPAVRQVSLAMPSQPEGRYILSAPGVEDWPFFLTDAPLSGVFAMITIHPRAVAAADGSGNAACLDANGHVMAQRYTIALDARALKWRYLIVPHASQTSDGWHIEGTWRRAGRGQRTEPIEFVRADAPLSVDGRNAVVFTSTGALRVGERLGEAMAIALKGDGLPEAVTLPFPDVTRGLSSYQPSVAEGAGSGGMQDAVADVFVYL